MPLFAPPGLGTNALRARTGPGRRPGARRTESAGEAPRWSPGPSSTPARRRRDRLYAPSLRVANWAFRRELPAGSRGSSRPLVPPTRTPDLKRVSRTPDPRYILWLSFRLPPWSGGPMPDDEIFPNPPLALVAFEVRYPDQPALTSRPAIEGIKAALADALPLRGVLREQEIGLRVDGPEAPTVQVRVTPRFTTRDRATACQVGAGSLIVETTTYAGFASFSELVQRAVEAAANTARPDGITRVGLRYIDEVRVPGIDQPPGNWHGYIDEHLLAPVAEDFVKAAKFVPRTWQGIVQYATGPDRVLALRYGPAEGYAVVPDGPTRRRSPPAAGLFFLLDSDSYWQPSDEVPEFEPERVMQACRELHDPTKALFNAVITERLREEVFRRQVAEEVSS